MAYYWSGLFEEVEEVVKKAPPPTGSQVEVVEEIPNLAEAVELGREKPRPLMYVERVWGAKRLRRLLDKLYWDLLLDDAQIAALFGVTRSPMRKARLRLGIKSRRPAPSPHYGVLSDRPEPPRRTLVKGIYRRVYTYVPDEDMAWLIGFITGDGWSSEWVVGVGNSEKGLHPILMDLLSRYGSVTPKYRYYWKENEEWKYIPVKTLEDANYFALVLSSTGFARLIGDEDGYRYDTAQFLLNRPTLAAPFIAGLWDADGSVRINRRAYIELWNTDNRILRLVGEHLKSKFGIQAILRLNIRKVEGETAAKKHLRGKLPYHRIRVVERHAPKFKETVGVWMRHPKKAAELVKLRSFIRSPEVYIPVTRTIRGETLEDFKYFFTGDRARLWAGEVLRPHRIKYRVYRVDDVWAVGVKPEEVERAKRAALLVPPSPSHSPLNPQIIPAVLEAISFKYQGLRRPIEMAEFERAMEMAEELREQLERLGLFTSRVRLVYGDMMMALREEHLWRSGEYYTLLGLAIKEAVESALRVVEGSSPQIPEFEITYRKEWSEVRRARSLGDAKSWAKRRAERLTAQLVEVKSFPRVKR